MVQLWFVIEEHGPTPSHLRTTINAIMRMAMYDVGMHWHTHMRPKHFGTASQVAEYGYAKRTAAYMIRKAKMWGHQRLLEYSGVSRARSERRDIRASASGCRIVLHTPALNWRRSPKSPDMRREMTTITQAEGKQLAEVANKSLSSQFKSLNMHTYRTIRTLGDVGQSVGLLQQLYDQAKMLSTAG